MRVSQINYERLEHKKTKYRVARHIVWYPCSKMLLASLQDWSPLWSQRVNN